MSSVERTTEQVIKAASRGAKVADQSPKGVAMRPTGSSISQEIIDFHINRWKSQK